MPLAVEHCPECGTKVVPMSDGTCPACRKRSFASREDRASAIVEACMVPHKASETKGPAEAPSGRKTSVGGSKSRWVAARPLLFCIAGVICLGMAVAWYPGSYGIVYSGGLGAGVEVSAEKYAESMDFLAQRGYGQLIAEADRARNKARREKEQKSSC